MWQLELLWSSLHSWHGETWTIDLLYGCWICNILGLIFNWTKAASNAAEMKCLVADRKCAGGCTKWCLCSFLHTIPDSKFILPESIQQVSIHTLCTCLYRGTPIALPAENKHVCHLVNWKLWCIKTLNQTFGSTLPFFALLQSHRGVGLLMISSWCSPQYTGVARSYRAWVGVLCPCRPSPPSLKRISLVKRTWQGSPFTPPVLRCWNSLPRLHVKPTVTSDSSKSCQGLNQPLTSLRIREPQRWNSQTYSSLCCTGYCSGIAGNQAHYGSTQHP